MTYIYYAIKRFFDIFFSLILLVILVPVWIVVPIAIKVDSPGPAIFVQRRRTKDGKVFNMYKFRSMIINAENTGTGLFNYENDPRVTRSGRIIRNTSIDELPQLVNVLKGDMSFVGPRPCVEYELGDYDTLNKKYKKRFNVKAGLTGWAQVKGRNDIPWDKKVEYDNQYIDLFNRYGCFIDIIVVLMTFVQLFKNDDIYEKKVDESMDSEDMARLEEERIIKLAHQQECD